MHGNKINWQHHHFSIEKLKQDNFISLYAYVHHKSLIDEIGYFNDTMTIYEFMLAQCIAYNPVYIDLCVVKCNAIVQSPVCQIAKTLGRSDKKHSIRHDKIVCYTCITNDYDSLYTPYVMPKNIDFICFTNSADEKLLNKWTIRKIPDELSHFSYVKQQRLIKILAHKWLPEYDVSIWIDGNIHIQKDLNLLL